MNTIIVAALAILVLVLTAFLLLRGAKDTDNRLRCEEQGGKCLAQCSDELPVQGPFGGCAETMKCCVDMGLGTGQGSK